jgi:hypothetical protein
LSVVADHILSLRQPRRKPANGEGRRRSVPVEEGMIGDTPTKTQGSPPAALQASHKLEDATGRQRTPQGRATARIVFRCEATLYDSIKAVADRNRLSMSETVRMMIATYLGNDGGRSSDLTRLAKSLRPLSRVRGITIRSRKALP